VGAFTGQDHERPLAELRAIKRDEDASDPRVDLGGEVPIMAGSAPTEVRVGRKPGCVRGRERHIEEERPIQAACISTHQEFDRLPFDLRDDVDVAEVGGDRPSPEETPSSLRTMGAVTKHLGGGLIQPVVPDRTIRGHIERGGDTEIVVEPDGDRAGPQGLP
jgi:hypothetical protein